MHAISLLASTSTNLQRKKREGITGMDRETRSMFQYASSRVVQGRLFLEVRAHAWLPSLPRRTDHHASDATMASKLLHHCGASPAKRYACPVLAPSRRGLCARRRCPSQHPPESGLQVACASRGELVGEECLQKEHKASVSSLTTCMGRCYVINKFDLKKLLSSEQLAALPDASILPSLDCAQLRAAHRECVQARIPPVPPELAGRAVACGDAEGGTLLVWL